MKKILEANDLVKIYNKNSNHPFTALHKINLEVYEGDFICIMGPSDSGKSTLINNLSTIDMPTSGSVKINDIDVHSMMEMQIGKFRYENLGFVFQSFNLMETLTIGQNIAVPLTLAKEKKETIQEAVNTVAKQLHIEEILEKFPQECSGGQCQRCAVARALVTSPSLIIADEPTGNLDSKSGHELMSILKELNEKQHVTILMVTHDAMIASYSKRLLFILDGNIDEDIKREEMDQRTYFHKITEINSKDSLDLLMPI